MREFITTFLLSLMSFGCTNLVYQPSREIFYVPSERVGVMPKDLTIPSLDGKKLHAWLFEPAEGVEPKGTVIQFHGNAENMTSHFLSLLWVVKEGYRLLAFDYRGYGSSEGAPYPAGVHMDALAVLQKADEMSGKKEKALIVYGQSLGGAIALRALVDFPNRTAIRTAVIEGSFLSYKRIAADKLSEFWLTWPLQWMGYLLMSDTYAPKKTVRSLSPLPILVLHGTKDEVVPMEHGRQIYDAAGEPKCFWPIESSAHGYLMEIDQGKYRKAMLDFFENLKCPAQTS